METMTLKIVAAEMRDYNRRVAPGSDCAAWQDFVADCFMRYDVAPWEDAAEDIEPVQEGVDYWHRIASGENCQYHAATGARLQISPLLASATRPSVARLFGAEMVA
jgi:hypothetical protein